MTRVVDIRTASITNWKNFHKYFKDLFGFPEFYGNNMNAWIDCMSSIDSPQHGMCMKIFVNPGETVTLNLKRAMEFKSRDRELYDAIIESAAFINRSRIEQGKQPVLIISFD